MTLQEVQMFFRFASALREFLKTTITVEEARTRIGEMMAAREDNFLRFVRAAVFGNTRSPYLPLLRRAGVEFGDVEKLVRTDGLETALERMEAEGVYVRLDEFKGRQPIRRPGLELPVKDTDFDNPLSRRHMEGTSGGSRGSGRKTTIDLNTYANTAYIHMLFLDGVGLLNRPSGTYRTALPNNSGFGKSLYQLRMGRYIERWFSEKKMTYGPSELKYALFTHYAHLAAALQGRRIPLPEHTPLDQAVKVARWLEQKKKEGTPAVLDAVTSVGVRVCLAALENGIDISGSVFRLGSEPFTEARAAVCRKAGVTVYPHYAMTDGGTVGLACAEPVEVDEVHLMKHRIAAIQRPHTVAGSDITVNTFYYTSLLPYASKVLLNMQSDDYGVMRKRNCGCALDRLGMDTHLHAIRSYEKLTSVGVTFIGTDLYTLLESVLPARFGGGPSDYQLVEEDIGGLPRLSLVISPRVGELDESKVVPAMLEFLAARNAGHRLMADALHQGANIRIVRREPYATSAFKIQPLHILQAQKPESTG